MKRHKFAWNFYICTPIFLHKTVATERSAVKILGIFPQTGGFFGVGYKPAGQKQLITLHRLWKCCAENVWWPFVLCLVRFDWFVSFIYLECVQMNIRF